MKVIRYHNYGMALESEPDENNIINDKFYFCLFELSNGRTLSLQTYKSYNNSNNEYEWNDFLSVDEKGNTINVGEYAVTYSDYYVFGEDFYDWFYKAPLGKDVKEWPKESEKNCIIDFYQKKIKDLENNK